MTLNVTASAPVLVEFVEPSMRVPLMCQCGACRVPFGYMLVRDGAVILEVQSRHNGEKHVNMLTIGAEKRTIE